MPPNWEITTACDIELGKYFAAGQPYEGYTVEIDADSALEALQIDSDRTYGPSSSILNLFKSDDVAESHKLMIVAGTTNITEATPDNLVYEPAVIKSTVLEDGKSLSSVCTIAIDEPKSKQWSNKGPCLIKMALRDNKSIAKSVRHEFKHAVDFSSRQKRASEADYQRFSRHSSGRNTLNDSGSFTQRFGTATYAFRALSKLRKINGGTLNNLDIERSSPSEARSYEAGEKEDKLTPIVSVESGSVAGVVEITNARLKYIEKQYPEQKSRAA